MDGKKVFSIEINGLQQSINAVDSLNKQLDTLEKRIEKLQGQNVNVNTGGGAKNLSAEERVYEQIEKTQQKINETREEGYKQLLKEKDALKEATEAQKAQAASQRLSSGEYANTMKGLKSQLADIKSLMQTTDLGSDDFKTLTERANELNSKLKEIEQSYGVFGRSVGDYKTAAKGFEGITLKVGESTVQFGNARQALKSLKTEMQTLSTKKDLGIISDEDRKRLEALTPAVKQLESSIQDAGKPMDSLLDTMESFTALVSAGKGFAAFFGLDGEEITRSIQQLMALQNAIKSIQTIQKQLQTGEGIGSYFSKGSEAIDNFVDKMFGLKKATEDSVAAEKAQEQITDSVADAAKDATTSIKAQDAATKALTGGMRAATIAANVLKVALKGLGIGLAIAAISELVDSIGSWISSIGELSEAEKAEQEAHSKSVEAVAKARTELETYLVKIDKFTGTLSQEKELVDELNKKYGEMFGTYKTLSEWKVALINNSEAYVRQMEAEAKAAVWMEKYQENYRKQIELEEALAKAKSECGEESIQVRMIQEELNKVYKNASDYMFEYADAIREANEAASEFERTSFGMGEAISKFTKSIVKAASSAMTKHKSSMSKSVVDVERELENLRLKVMMDGLNKRLIQLEEEKRQTLIKLKSNQNAYLEAEKLFEKKRKQIFSEYANDISNSISELNSKNIKVGIEIDNKDLKNKLERKYLDIDEITKNIPPIDHLFTNATGSVVRSLIINNNSRLQDLLKESYQNLEEYYNNSTKLVIDKISSIEKIEKEAAENGMRQAKKDNDDSLKEEKKGIDKTIRELEDSLKNKKKLSKEEERQLTLLLADAYEARDELLRKHKENEEIIEKEYDNNIYRIEVQNAEKVESVMRKFYEDQISLYRNYLSKINNRIANNNPILTALGFVDVKETRKKLQDTLATIKKELEQVNNSIARVTSDYVDGNIGGEAYNSLINQLTDVGSSLYKASQETTDAINQLAVVAFGKINVYLQAVGQSANQILSSLSEIQSNKYEKMIEEQEKYIEQYEDLLDKQRDKTQEYADAVNEIENELSTARGDRRQQLIDALNAEMTAQRASIAQEKKIEKEKEKAEEKRKQLEIKQAEARKKMDLAQAYINAAMAISMAAVNRWPLPAIPMMALATAVGAAQIAAIKSQNIPTYGDGGVIEGRSHSQGGVKVLGGRAEVEGGEFITNKRTTSQNVDVLEYINTQKRKLNIDDFISFYSGNVKKNITTTSPRMKFADGGQIPTLRNDISINNGLLTAFEDYANRPTYVSVVEIENAQARVNNVRAISGLNA